MAEIPSPKMILRGYTRDDKEVDARRTFGYSGTRKTEKALGEPHPG
jgi:hypothetical protein